MILKTSRGTINGMVIGDDYTDIYGLRRTTKLDMSQYDRGVITEHIEGGITNRLDITFNDEGDPVLIADSAGHSMEVVW